MSYRLGYPAGDVVTRDRDLPLVGYDIDGYRVDYVRAGDDRVVFMGLHLASLHAAGLVHSDVAPNNASESTVRGSSPTSITSCASLSGSPG